MGCDSALGREEILTPATTRTDLEDMMLREKTPGPYSCQTHRDRERNGGEPGTEGGGPGGGDLAHSGYSSRIDAPKQE